MHAKERSFKLNDRVFIRDFPKAKTWLPGKIVAVKGPLSYHVELSDGRIVRRHVDHIKTNKSNDQQVNGTNSEIELPPPQPPLVTDNSGNESDTLLADPSLDDPPERRVSTRTHTRPDYYGYQLDVPT